MGGCATCRNDALKQAEIKACEGKESRVVVYYIGNADKALDLWQHDRHAQAQVKTEDVWKWLSNSKGEIEEKPEKTLIPYKGNDFLYYSTEEFRDYLRESGLELERLTCEELLKKKFPWATLLLILLLI